MFVFFFGALCFVRRYQIPFWLPMGGIKEQYIYRSIGKRSSLVTYVVSFKTYMTIWKSVYSLFDLTAAVSVFL